MTDTDGASTQDEVATGDPPSGDAHVSDETTRGTYELLRDRLLGHAGNLRTKADTLNRLRLEAFGQSRFEIAGSERIRTDNNCVPRDIVGIGDHLLFGYNVFIGLRSDTDVADVFNAHHFTRSDGFALSPSGAGVSWLEDPEFERDFRELYTYYKAAKLLQIRRIEGRLLAIFQTGDALTDIRVFRWNVDPDGTVSYLDNRGERDHVFPPQFDFEWSPVGRDSHVTTRRPHVSILDKVFVDPLNGTLDIRIEDNTPTGELLLSEPVSEPDQALADCEIWFAELGDIVLLRVQPYREAEPRFLVVNTFARSAKREDAIGRSCQQLPDEHGVIHAGGIELRTGESKSFDVPFDGMEFKTAVRSPNGEDVMYVFHERSAGRSILMAYNLIRREVAAPIQCHGYGLFEDGTMVVFREQDEPTRVHPMQIWATPFVTDEFHARQPIGEGLLHRVGNAELVRGVSESLAIEKLVADTEPTVAVFEDLARRSSAVVDAHHWLDDEEVGALASDLRLIKDTAELIIDEFEKVQELQAAAAELLEAAEHRVAALSDDIRTNPPDTSTAFVEVLGRMRREQGELITHRSVRYVDRERIDVLEANVLEMFDRLSARAVEFLSGDGAFAGFHSQIDNVIAATAESASVALLEPVMDEIDEIGSGLDLLTGVVGGLDIEDATVRTAILEQVSETLGALNRARALGDGRRLELRRAESTAAFGVEFSLFSQAVASEISRATTPEACDAGLGSLMVQLENLEGTFGAFDEYLAEIATKREDVYESFASRKQQLLDERQQSAVRLVEAAERILQSIQRRLEAFDEIADINAYFASDPMVTKVRSIADELRDIDEPVRADEMLSRLERAQDEAARSLRDRSDIFEAGGEIIRLGRHRFSVDTQSLELTTAVADGEMQLVLTGTDYRETVTDPGLISAREYWDQVISSESAWMYRSVHLATRLLAEDPLTVADLGTDDQLLAHVQTVAAVHFDEGYDRGVHDHDATKILRTILDSTAEVGLQRIGPASRAAAILYFDSLDAESQRRLAQRCHNLGVLRTNYPSSPAVRHEVADLADEVTAFVDENQLSGTGEAARSAEYLFEELTAEAPSFILSPAARDLHDALWAHHDALLSRTGFEQALSDSESLGERLEIATAWLRAYAEDAQPDDVGHVPEAAAMIAAPDAPRTPGHGTLALSVEGLLGQHPTINAGTIVSRLDDLLDAGARFRRENVPGFAAYQRSRHALIESRRNELRLGEYAPHVMSGFVRNRLIDEVYLPLIGDNLAKQIGTAGGGQTSQLGLLLLISPPGYGKTTLMEYVANRLGMVFVKVNGPALGTGVTSLDSDEAPNATAAQEVDKVNFALEMGNNVLLYVDDIQHTNPEFLQKFISMTDAQRRMEGVWNGRTRTYDMRGKRFAVVMAGNPYTESGERFSVPDMLANRADTYNLGDVLGGRDELFALSYIENALTANSIVAPLGSRDRTDVHKLLDMVRSGSVSGDDLSHGYSAVELSEIVATFERLVRVRDVVMRVNEAYIESASMEDSTRTEPPFQLQGSYRNMNRLAEKVLPAMNDDELDQLIDDHYLGEAQTLTSGAEANLLKLGSLRGTHDATQESRWSEVVAAFQRTQLLGGGEEDPMVRVAGAVTGITDQLRRIADRD